MSTPMLPLLHHQISAVLPEPPLKCTSHIGRLVQEAEQRGAQVDGDGERLSSSLYGEDIIHTIHAYKLNPYDMLDALEALIRDRYMLMRRRIQLHALLSVIRSHFTGVVDPIRKPHSLEEFLRQHKEAGGSAYSQKQLHYLLVFRDILHEYLRIEPHVGD